MICEVTYCVTFAKVLQLLRQGFGIVIHAVPENIASRMAIESRFVV